MKRGASREIVRVLSIAGTDPTGGAGIHADLKSIAAHGGYGMAVVTALVAQNTRGVRAVHVPPAGFVGEQLRAVSDDVGIDAVKIGMLGDAAIAGEVSAWLVDVRPPVVVLDPVMVATSGHSLAGVDAVGALLALLPHVDVVTPNLPELAALLGTEVAVTWPDALAQGAALAAAHQVLVLVKGGHLGGPLAPDAIVGLPSGVVEFSQPRVATNNTHGTGCSLSAGLATRYAQCHDWSDALEHTKAWLSESLNHADELDVGNGNGPINHFHGLWARAAPEVS